MAVRERNACKYLVKNLIQSDHFEDLGMDGKDIIRI